MLPRWKTLVAVLGLGVQACAVAQHQEVTVVVRIEPPLRGYAMGATSLGETPGDLSAAQINAALEGHGAWTESATYGRIWRPHEGVVTRWFAPYVTAGQWVATDVGWYWQSAYPWGRVAFHYGRWVLVGSSWSWVPGSRFAPAWVEWRRGNGWVGWSALAPAGARAWAPYQYCPEGALSGALVERRVVGGAAGSSLFARTTAVADDGVPRGPSVQGQGGAVASLVQVWNTPFADDSRGVRPALAATAEGVDSVEPIPVALLREASQPSEPAAGGATVVIRDRNLLGMTEGPSVRRPAGASLSLPDPVNHARADTVVILPLPASRGVAVAVPPPLPPPPDGAPGVGFFAGFPLRTAGRRAEAPAPASEALAVVVAPSAAPVARPAAPRPMGVSSGAYLGARGGFQASGGSAPAGPFSTVQ